MSRVRSRDTQPELRVRKVAHAAGLRFRLHRRDLPGTPDLVFPKHKLAVFVHGCFWHRHPGCKRASMPAARQEFWRDKFEKNVARDRAALKALAASAWSSIIIWECQTNDADAVRRILLDSCGCSPNL
ncbi:MULTISPECIES: very short patch repair endonuclease [Sphingomonas]|uniref:Very short patch repair endonuclease n=1 Tax=Sphingomonas molluscorum TaxID=418184 RepID=A0ABU8Q1Q6_9SPHN|nr:very short patch repair endonuclease [Sphingomonas sp. JUb134]